MLPRKCFKSLYSESFYVFKCKNNKHVSISIEKKKRRKYVYEYVSFYIRVYALLGARSGIYRTSQTLPVEHPSLDNAGKLRNLRNRERERGFTKEWKYTAWLRPITMKNCLNCYNFLKKKEKKSYNDPLDLILKLENSTFTLFWVCSFQRWIHHLESEKVKGKLQKFKNSF